MKRVLITRPEPGAAETAARVVELGHIPVVAPVLSIIPMTVCAPANLAATLLTSRNAVAACPASVYARPVFTVGAATADRAAEVGFSRVFSADGDAKALTALIASRLRPADGSLFLPTGEGQGNALAEDLRRIGFNVILQVAYKAAGVDVLPESAATNLRNHLLTAAMFFSGETARHFVHLLQTAGLSDCVRGIEALSISERAAVALRPLPWRRIKVAVKPNQEEMLVLLND